MVVNYNAVTIAEDLVGACAAMVHHMETHYDAQVSRYISGAFMRFKLAEVLTRKEAPPIFET